MGVERESVLVTSGATGVLGWNIEEELEWNRRVVVNKVCNLIGGYLKWPKASDQLIVQLS